MEHSPRSEFCWFAHALKMLFPRQTNALETRPVRCQTLRKRSHRTGKINALLVVIVISTALKKPLTMGDVRETSCMSHMGLSGRWRHVRRWMARLFLLNFRIIAFKSQLSALYDERNPIHGAWCRAQSTYTFTKFRRSLMMGILTNASLLLPTTHGAPFQGHSSFPSSCKSEMTKGTSTIHAVFVSKLYFPWMGRITRVSE